ncbi:MAG: SPFH domain-containing protein [Candidatus Helarchaeota archaeon]
MQYEMFGFVTWLIVGIIFGIIALIIVLSVYISRIVVVPPSEFHVVVSKNKRKTYDGKGRYFFFKTFNRRIIIPKRVLDIEISKIRLHDKHNLPFELEISCKIQVRDPNKAAESLGAIDELHLKRITEDTVMSSARSICMQMEILTIMREREAVETAIYKLIVDSLLKLGLEPVIFDIKNISDTKESTVIKDFERVKSAELRKEARVAESIHLSEAEIMESERHKLSQVKREQDLLEEEKAKIEREMIMAEKNKELTIKKMLIKEEEIRKAAEIEKEKLRLQAEAEAEAIKLRAQAEADAIKLKAEAEASGIRDKAKALEEYQKAGEKGLKIKSLEIIANALVKQSEFMAKGLQNNSKVILMGGGDNNQTGATRSMLNLMPMFSLFTESGMFSLLADNSKKDKD